ncbi:MAG: SUF system Fe-S cluster assembly regulator [Lysobacterales bacterium]
MKRWTTIMLRIGKLTDYATVLMTCLAGRERALLPASELAVLAHLELPTVSKLLKLLAAAGLVESRRGSKGGYRLARAPASISVLDIVVALEGPMGMTECSASKGACDHEVHCQVQHNWQRISRLIAASLAEVSLDAMRSPTPPPSGRGKSRSIPLTLA